MPLNWRKTAAWLITSVWLLGFSVWSIGTSYLADAAGTPASSNVNIKGDFYDMASHWAADTVSWGVSLQIVNGYDDGGFHPDQKVTEAEFVAMLLRAFSVTNAGYAESLNPWYGVYFSYAAGQNWPIEAAMANEPYLRGDLARLIVATQGQQQEMDGAIEFLLQHGLAQGKTAPTVDGFGKYDALTRAESLQIIRNLVDKRLTLSAAPPLDPALSQNQAAFSVRGVAIGDFENTVIAKLGQPQRKDASEYAFQWYVYNSDYNNYSQIGIMDSKVVALYTNAANWASEKGLKAGSPSADLKAAYGDPLTSITKGNTHYSLNDQDKEPTYLIKNSYVTFFLDLHEKSQLTAVQVIQKEAENTKNGFYGTPSEALRAAFEKEAFDLANVSRARASKKPFIWNEQIAGTARKHSKDMADNNYFDHYDLTGKSPFDRMKDDGIVYRSAAENIAAGQTSAIFAHSGWMNSFEGHREAILGSNDRLGVGVYFGGSMKVYYTQNFYTSR